MVVRRWWSPVRWSLVLAGLLMICLGTASLVQAKEVSITMGDNFFEPATVTVAVGDTVTWTHRGNRPHDVTADGGAFSSPRRMSNGQSFTYTATTAGTFSYICTIHPNQMRATLVVQAAGAGGVGMPRTGAGGLAGDTLAVDIRCWSASAWRCWPAWGRRRPGGATSAEPAARRP